MRVQWGGGEGTARNRPRRATPIRASSLAPLGFWGPKAMQSFDGGGRFQGARRGCHLRSSLWRHRSRCPSLPRSPRPAPPLPPSPAPGSPLFFLPPPLSSPAQVPAHPRVYRERPAGHQPADAGNPGRLAGRGERPTSEHILSFQRPALVQKPCPFCRLEPPVPLSLAGLPSPLLFLPFLLLRPPTSPSLPPPGH